MNLKEFIESAPQPYKMYILVDGKWRKINEYQFRWILLKNAENYDIPKDIRLKLVGVNNDYPFENESCTYTISRGKIHPKLPKGFLDVSGMLHTRLMKIWYDHIE